MSRDAVEYYESFSQAVKDFCLPLDSFFGISFFVYTKFYVDGRYLLISNDDEYNKHFIKNVDFSNVYFRNYVNSKSSYETIFWPTEPKNLSMQVCHDFNHWNGMTFILEKTAEFIEMVGFATAKANSRIYEQYCRHALVLEIFVNQFKQKFSKEIAVPPLDKRLGWFKKRVDICVPDNKIIDDKGLIELFYQETGIADEITKLNFTSAELKVLKSISLGCSAKLIALDLGISPRTVENHLYHIRQKSGLSYKSDLVDMATRIFCS